MLLLVAGCPATGKSRYARILLSGIRVIEFDEWVCMWYGVPFVDAMDRYSYEYPKSQHEYFNEIGIQYLQNRNIVVCDTFTYRKDRLDFLEYMNERFNIPTYETSIKYLVASYPLIKKRNQERKTVLPENIILTMYYNQQYPVAEEGFGKVEIVSNEYQ